MLIVGLMPSIIYKLYSFCGAEIQWNFMKRYV